MAGKEKKRFWLALLWAALLLAADLVTKELCVGYLAEGRHIELIPGVLELTYVRNRGAAFGILQNRQWIFTLIAAAAILVLLFLLRRSAQTGGEKTGRGQRVFRVSLVLLLAGAAGNLADRLRWGYVVDFIYVRLIDFPVFNVADICVTLGCGLLLWYTLADGR